MEKLFLNFLFSFVVIMLQIVSEAAVKKTCVLYFERQEYPLWAQMQSVFKDRTDTVIIDLAKPTDFARCINEYNAEEILVFSHSIPISSTFTRLSYFSQLSKSEYEKKIFTFREELMSLELKIRDEIEQSSCFDFGADSTTTCTELEKKLVNINYLKGKFLNNLDLEDRLTKLTFGYDNRMIYARPFDNLLQLLRERESRGGSNLSRIRFLSCDPKKVVSSYKTIKEIQREFGVQIDLAPESKIMSALLGRSVTTFDREWVSQRAERLK